MDLGETLTQKLGPLPVWAWGGILGGAGVAYLIWQRSKSSSSASQAASSSAQGTTPSPQNGYPPTVVVTPASASNTTSSTSTSSTSTGLGTVTLGGAPGQPNSGIWSSNVAAYPGPSNTGAYQTLPFGTYQLAGNPQNNLYPISGPGGGTLWINAENVLSYSQSGQGGGSLFTGGRGGGRTDMIRSFTPFQVSQYVDGSGGMGGVGGVAQRLGISHERLASLNYHLRRPNGSYAGGITRVA